MYALERKIAQLAVTRACKLAKTVASASSTESITKSDDSPVTVADFGAQAIIINAINNAFPNDKIVGEEDASKLRQDPNLRSKIWNLVQEASNDNLDIPKLNDENEMCDTIDKGNSEGGNQGRIWALDPIDGTKGFIRKGQYAVCLALIIDGKVELGVIGCPNLDGGSLFSAAKSQGAFVSSLDDPNNQQPISFNKDITVETLGNATFCESVESGHSNQGTQAQIANKLGITKEPVRMDSQAKYCSISQGQGEIYLRLPVTMSYQEKIWDHAAGNVLVTEAGGTVTDMYGKELDFGHGRTLGNNKGVVASAAGIHDAVLKAVKEVTDVNKIAD